jgi:cytidine deaminase
VVVFGVEGGHFDRFTVGHNDEACNLKNSACAEGAAFLHLSALAQGATLRVHAVYITSDAAFSLTPGALCREYMQSSPWVTPATRVIMEGTAGAGSRAETTLAALWPYPSVYTRLTRAEQMDLGAHLGPIVWPALESAAAAHTPEGIDCMVRCCPSLHT